MNNEASIPTRYPEDISKLIKGYNKQIAERYLKIPIDSLLNVTREKLS